MGLQGFQVKVWLTPARLAHVETEIKWSMDRSCNTSHLLCTPNSPRHRHPILWKVRLGLDHTHDCHLTCQFERTFELSTIRYKARQYDRSVQ